MATIDRRGATVSAADPPIATNPNPDLAIKAPVRVATTGSNITLSGLQTIDGVVLAAGDRVLVKDQTDATTNGLYNAATSTWTRTIDANNNSEFSQGLQVIVTSGTIGAGNTYRLTTANPITLGTSLLTFTFQAVIGWVNVKTFLARGDGVTDDTASINLAIAALPVAGGTLYFPAGTYLISSTLAIPSNVRVTGDGWNSVIKGAATFATYAAFTPSQPAYFLLTNNNYGSGNSNIVIDNIASDWSNKATGAPSHCVHLRNVSHAQVSRCLFTSGNDGIAITASKFYAVDGCHAVGQSNCGLDQWDGCTDGAWTGNTVDCQNVSGSFGILATGITTTGGANTSLRIKIVGNTVRNTNLTGIWVQGGAAGSATDIVVADNTVDTCNIGIRVSEAQRIVVVGNAISNTQNQAIALAAESVSAGQNCTITGNLINNASQSGSGNAAAIDLQNTATGNVVAGNIVRGTNHSYGILTESGASTNIVVDNIVQAGASGSLGNQGVQSNLLAAIPGLLRFALTGINFNSANTDNAIQIATGTNRYKVDRISISNASASISTATIGVFTSTGGGGSSIAANQAITVTATGADAVNNSMDLTLNAALPTFAMNDTTLQIRIGSAQGSAATADVIIYVRPLT